MQILKYWIEHNILNINTTNDKNNMEFSTYEK